MTRVITGVTDPDPVARTGLTPREGRVAGASWLFDHPEEGVVWELPGGGIDPGETYIEAAIRELAEETGIVAEPSDIGAPTWRRRVTFKHAGVRRIQRQQSPDELETFVEARWWSVDDVEASAERFFPGALPSLPRPFLDGERASTGGRLAAPLVLDCVVAAPWQRVCYRTPNVRHPG